MDTLRITTEDAEAEQWRLLSQFAYPSNIQDYLKQHSNYSQDVALIELIAGCIRQGEAYFSAAKDAPLDISPLLYYYGSTNLLTGAYALLQNSRPNIENHGMTIIPGQATRIADIKILPRNPSSGGLQLFCNAFSNSINICNGHSWTLGEVLGSIPDIRVDFRSQYNDLATFTVPVEIVETRQRRFERIEISQLDNGFNAKELHNLIMGFNQSYISQQTKTNYVILHKKIKGDSIGEFSITGRKYLPLVHKKGNANITLRQVILLHMGLFALGFLPRYRPELWNPFVQRDTTGEKRVIEKFITVCRRYIPNLILNALLQQRVHFTFGSDGVLDLRAAISDEHLSELIREAIQEMRQKGVI